MAQEPDRDAYEVLGVGPGAAPAEVTSAYRRLLRDLHPDSHTGRPPESRNDTARLGEVLAAYEVLRDPARRAAYDERRRSAVAPRAGRVAIPVRRVDRDPAGPERPPLMRAGPVRIHRGAGTAGGQSVSDTPVAAGDLLRAIEVWLRRWA